MFIASKSRLLPLGQKPSISRLELEAAVIATRLKNTIVKRFLLKRGTHFYRQIRKECSVILTIMIPILG